MDYIPPDNTDDRGYVARKEVVFFGSPWLVLCGVILFAVIIVGGIFAFRFVQKSNNSHIALSSIDKKSFHNVFQSDSDVTVIAAVSSNPDPSVSTNTNDVSLPLVVAIRSKDSLPRVFKRLGINDKSAVNIIKLKQAKALKSIRVGHKLSLLLDPTKTKVQKLMYEIDALNTLVVTSVNNRWQVKENHITPTSKIKYVAATINESIYAAGKQSGIPRKLMAQIVDVLNYKVNVNRIRSGSKLALFYKEYDFINGKKVRDSEIVAIELAHADKMCHIIGFTDPHGYTNFYTPDGRSIKPSFVRYPMNFRKVNSRFSFSRVHPILGFARPHLGVDFAARTGTPIKATSNGRVDFMGRKGGYGKTIIIKKGVYSTLYAHLSRYAGDMHWGKYVKQGEVIGYAGASGLATSSHLHYEFRINGIHHDPLKVKLPSGEMIAAEYRGSFFALSKKMLAQLDSNRKANKVFAMYLNSKFE